MKGGTNLFIYAQNNPLNFIDPLGLKVLAKCDYASGGEIVGGGGLSCKLEEIECKNGYRTTADYSGIFYGITVGLTPLGGSYFTMIFDVYSVDSLAGRASILTSTATVGGGASIGQICLGSGCTDFGVSPAFGVDISWDGFEGYGWVTNKKQECCN